MFARGNHRTEAGITVFKQAGRIGHSHAVRGQQNYDHCCCSLFLYPHDSPPFQVFCLLIFYLRIAGLREITIQRNVKKHADIFTKLLLCSAAEAGIIHWSFNGEATLWNR
jgi:hypothetical protein